ncbi:putative ABC transport system permease protein [Chryseolinea serpens]|uniref:Putative ABC transport system permease protein n=1 Tax=Chryseolinea serpens TaxID=947013 RepID=A0A1M5K6Q8_9BACT|nr:ABC transporter permease [Chryseolinea serpens]SHG48517.1 putative ABC transport system permease protein [Chryseolinea serpens]
MVQSYFVVAWRNLQRNKVFTFINVVGLAVGIAVVFMIYQYIQAERSYDLFHKNVARLYRVPIEYTGALAARPSATNHPAIGPALKAEFPEVQDFARMMRASMFFPANTFTFEGDPNRPVTFNEEAVFIADKPFLSMFSFPFVEGDTSALREPNSLVLTRKVAKKYFGDKPAAGNTLLFNRMPCKVTAVVDVPENSHLQFDVLVSFSSLGPEWGYTEWAWPEFYNYVLLAEGASPQRLEAKFPAFMEKHSAKIWEQYKFKSHIWLQPVADIHLQSDYSLEQSANGSERTVYFLTLLGIFILVIAWINYINLSTAKALERSKEVGLRKVSGASRVQLISQFFFDAFLVNVLSIALAIIIVLLVTPYFESLTGKHFSQILMSMGAYSTPYFWLSVVVALLIGILLVGIYPALVLSSFNPATVLKGKFIKSGRGALLRKGMVVFQYVLSMILVAGTLTMSTQMQFMQRQDLGYDKDQMLVVRATAIGDSTYHMHVTQFENSVKQLSQVQHLAKSSEVPGHVIAERNNVRRITQDENGNVGTFFIMTDENFFQTYGMQVLAGRNLTEQERFIYVPRDVDPKSEKIITDDGYLVSGAPNRIMINEALAQLLGYTSAEAAINEKVVFEQGRKFVGVITGVIKNHNQLSLREKYQPVIYYYPSYDYWSYFSIKINLNASGASETIAQVSKLYTDAFPTSAFEYFFLDDHFNNQYKNDLQFTQLFGVFTILAIIISSLGLLGLGIFNVTQRIREIAIRRVLGSSVGGILLLFSKETIWLLVMAYGISLPIIILGIKSWLDNFAFRVGLEWQMVILPPMLLLFISLVTIVFVTLRSAATSPAVSLKTE